MKEGLISVPTVNNDIQLITQRTCEDFVVWFSEYLERECPKKAMVEVVKDSLDNQYTLKYQDMLNFTKRPKDIFFRWIRDYCRLKTIPFGEYRKTDDVIYLYADGATIERCNAQKNKVRK